MVTVALMVSMAGAEQIIVCVLLVWLVDDVVHVTVDLVIGGVHISLYKLLDSNNTCTLYKQDKPNILVK